MGATIQMNWQAAVTSPRPACVWVSTSLWRETETSSHLCPPGHWLHFISSLWATWPGEEPLVRGRRLGEKQQKCPRGAWGMEEGSPPNAGLGLRVPYFPGCVHSL